MKLYSTTNGIARGNLQGNLELLGLDAPDLGALLAVDPTLQTARTATVTGTMSIDEAALRAPVPRPGAVFCVGANYESHVEEVKTLMGSIGDEESLRSTLARIREAPMFFSVPSSAVAGPRDPIVLPKLAPSQVDYEGEIAVVIGRGGKDVRPEEVSERIAGLTLANDVSARDLQARAMSSHELEFGHAKGLDGFKPMGPCLVTLDEFSEPLEVALETRVNGDIRQEARLSRLIHDIPRCVSHISKFHTLSPGDVILTGSPAGVGFFQSSFLQPGDVVEITATGLGSLRNAVESESDGRTPGPNRGGA